MTYQKEWYERNKERWRSYNKKSYEKNKDKRLKAKKEYCIENKERIKLARKERYLRRKLLIFQALGDKCKSCLISDMRVLQIDHVSGGGRKEIQKYRSDGLINHYHKQLIQDKVSFERKYQILCANCNWIKRVEKGET